MLRSFLLNWIKGACETRICSRWVWHHNSRSFYREIGQGLLAGQPWGERLDDLDEILSGNYGLLPPTFRLVWCRVDVALTGLGYAETVHQLTQRLHDRPPTVLIKTAWALRSAL